MTVKTLKDLLIHEIMDVYDAEEQLVAAIPKMAMVTTSPELQNALLLHLEVTKEQVKRLDRVIAALGVKRQAQPCPGMRGIVQEGEKMLGEIEPGPVLDAAIIGSAQKVEHYEICAYGTLRTFAEEIGEREVVQLLEQTLEEEKLSDKLLTELAQKGRINAQAKQPAGASARPMKPQQDKSRS